MTFWGWLLGIFAVFAVERVALKAIDVWERRAKAKLEQRAARERLLDTLNARIGS
jgi:hypothetical protein